MWVVRMSYYLSKSSVCLGKNASIYTLFKICNSVCFSSLLQNIVGDVQSLCYQFTVNNEKLNNSLQLIATHFTQEFWAVFLLVILMHMQWMWRFSNDALVNANFARIWTGYASTSNRNPNARCNIRLVFRFHGDR